MIATRRPPLDHQEAMWSAATGRREGLLSVPTGMGKTYAAYLGPLALLTASPRRGLTILWITPLKAMARDLERALAEPVEDLGLPVTVASRTGDTPERVRRRLRRNLPEVLLTTPESLTLLLSYEDAGSQFAALDTVIVDEWHELVGTKRGTQTELALARLRHFSPGVRTWALSATLANPEQMAAAAVGTGGEPVVITGPDRPQLEVRTLLPPADTFLPWFGFMGSSMFDAVVDALEPERATLIFTNTRNQAERWYRAIIERRPEWFARSGLHHGSIDLTERARVEAGLADGEVSLVVCTSSLDLGVDFAPVDQVVQIGSPRGIARFLQRAGRSGHRPGVSSRILLVPTHAMQLAEFAALQRALEDGTVESRRPLDAPIDVLVQHLVTCALGGGFAADELFREVRSTVAYRSLPRSAFDWSLQFLEHGGSALASYPQYRRIARGEDGRYRIASDRLARIHRGSIGTITSDGVLRVRFRNGRQLGHVDERSVTGLKPGQRFLFAGRALELVLMREGDVWVRPARSADHVPKWTGDELPLSEPLSDALEALLREVRDTLAARGDDLEALGPEMVALTRLFRVQARAAAIPDGRHVLAEICHTARSGSHLFLFCFGGRLAHQGLASLLAWRLSREAPLTFAVSVNDYALELHCPTRCDFAAALQDPALFSTEGLDAHALGAVNAAELGRRRFRRIARVAGLVFEGWPAARKTARQLQTSAGLLYDVLARHEPDNLLLEQARREVLDAYFDAERLTGVLERINRDGLEVVESARPSPMAFPLVLDRVEARVSSESARQRLERMRARWTEAMQPAFDAAADGAAADRKRS